MISKRNNWRRVCLSDVVERHTERYDDPTAQGLDRYVKVAHFDLGDLRLSRWGSVVDGQLPPTFKFVFRRGMLLYPTRSPNLRQYVCPDFDGICGEKTLVIKSKDTGVLLSELLPFLFSTDALYRHCNSVAVGSVNAHVRWRDLAAYEFALPPLEEQRRIAEVLMAAEEGIQKMSDFEVSLESVFTSRLEHYLSVKQGHLPLIAVAKLLSEPPRNGLSPATNSDSLGLKTVSISAVSDGRFNPEGNIKFAEVEYDRASPFFVRAGDVFAVRGNGNRNITGKVGIADRDYDELFYPDLLIRMRFDEAQILPLFALAQWNLPSVHRRLIARAKSSNGIWKVNGQDIRAHALFAPSLSEQQSVLDELSAIKLQKQECVHRRAKASRIQTTLFLDTLGVRA
jgi:type I restriction enzyme, S subunit